MGNTKFEKAEKKVALEKQDKPEIPHSPRKILYIDGHGKRRFMTRAEIDKSMKSNA